MKAVYNVANVGEFRPGISFSHEFLSSLAYQINTESYVVFFSGDKNRPIGFTNSARMDGINLMVEVTINDEASYVTKSDRIGVVPCVGYDRDDIIGNSETGIVLIHGYLMHMAATAYTLQDLRPRGIIQ